MITYSKLKWHWWQGQRAAAAAASLSNWAQRELSCTALAEARAHKPRSSTESKPLKRPSAKQTGMTPSSSNRISSSPKPRDTLAARSRILLPIPMLSAEAVSRSRMDSWPRFMASPILTDHSPMLSVTLLRSRMPANQPMRPDTGNPNKMVTDLIS